MNRIYMDNAATTRVTEPVFEAMKLYFCEKFGNPMSCLLYTSDAADEL